MLQRWWIRLFHTSGETVENKEAAEHPYRASPSAEPELEHPPDCEGCAFMRKHGPWKPPEIILTSGLPVECLLIGYEMTLDELDDMAERCGVLILRKQGDEDERDQKPGHSDA